MSEKRFVARIQGRAWNGVVYEEKVNGEELVCRVEGDRFPGMAERIARLLNKDEEEKGEHE